MYLVHRVGIMYLGLGMRYESEIWTIVISMNRAFKWCQFCCRLNFDPKSWKTMDYSLCLSAIFGKNVTVINNHFKLESSFDADHNGRNPSFISQLHNEIQFVFLWMFVVLWTTRTELQIMFICLQRCTKTHLVISQTFMWSSHKDRP